MNIIVIILIDLWRKTIIVIVTVIMDDKIHG